ncbi:MAG: hypothetical protein JSR72_03505 [Proteobacteria bacterium]|nr:hypothetical protein [Pseudomonadota bacterium]
MSEEDEEISRLRDVVAVATFEFNNASSDREMYEASVRRENALRDIRRRQEVLRKAAMPLLEPPKSPEPQPTPPPKVAATEKVSSRASAADDVAPRKSVEKAGQSETAENEAPAGQKGSHAWILPALLSVGLLAFGYTLHQLYQSMLEREQSAVAAIKRADIRSAEAADARKQANEELQRTTAFLRELNERGKRLDAKSAELDARQRSVEARESALNASRAAISPPASSPVPAQPAAPEAQPLPPALQNLDVETCDRLAANPTDANRRAGVAGTPYPALRQNVAAAVEVCARALTAAPTDNRLRYQYARALQAAGRQDQALPYLQQLANQMYPAAFNNLAQLYMQRGQPDIGIGLLRRGAENGDADSMVDLAGLIESGQTPARFPQEPMQLLQRAAELGHQGAAREMANRQTQKQVIDMFGNIVRTIGR